MPTNAPATPRYVTRTNRDTVAVQPHLQYHRITPRYDDDTLPPAANNNDNNGDDDTVMLELPPAANNNNNNDDHDDDDDDGLEEVSYRVAMAIHIWENIDPPDEDGLDGEAVITRMQAKCKQNSLVLSPLFTEMCRTSTCTICYNVYDDGPRYPMAMVPCKHVLCYSCCKRIMGETVVPCPVCRTLPVNIEKVPSTATMMRNLLEEEEQILEQQLQKEKQNPDIADVFKNFLLNRLELARCQQMGFLETACKAAKEELDLHAEIRSVMVKEEYDRLSGEIVSAFENLLGMDNPTLLQKSLEILKDIGARDFFSQVRSARKMRDVQSTSL